MRSHHAQGTRGEVGDSGVSKRIFAKLMQVMSDTSLRGRVLWLAASNRPDLIDEAMKRPGRFDLKIPFFMPNAEARKAIFEAMFRKYHIQAEVSDEVLTTLAEKTEGWSGAELEQVVLRGFKFAQDT